MPPVELSANTVDSSTTPTTVTPAPGAFVAPAARARIGIIYPPPEVRSKHKDTVCSTARKYFRVDIVDKTASFVARNGPSFESKVKDAEANNAKFNFLNPHDPYHAYYLHKVKEFMEGKATMPGGTDQGTAVVPTPVIQPATTKVSFLSIRVEGTLIEPSL